MNGTEDVAPAENGPSAVPRPSKPRQTIRAFFGGTNSAAPSVATSDDGSATSKPAAKRPKRKSAAASDALTQMQLGAFGRTEQEQSEAEQGSEAGPSKGWKLAAPPPKADAVKPKRKRKTQDDEDMEVQNMSAGVKPKPAGRKGTAALEPDAVGTEDGNATTASLDEPRKSSAAQTGRQRRGKPRSKAARNSPPHTSNGSIDISQSSPSRSTPRQRAKRKRKVMDKDNDGSVSTSGTIVDDDDDEVEVVRESMVIEDSPPAKAKPKSLMWTGRPAHPFFGGLTNFKAVETSDHAVRDLPSQGQEEEPEVPESAILFPSSSPANSTAKLRRPVQTTKPEHGCFAGGGLSSGKAFVADEAAGVQAVSRPGWGRSHSPLEGPYPTAEQQHVGREQTRKREGTLPAKRARQRSFPEREDGDFWNRLHTRSLASEQISVNEQPPPSPEAITSEYDGHPAIRRIHDGLIARFNHESWVDRYRPTAAEEVIGNEQQAGYLVKWLRELSIGTSGLAGEAKRNVLRKVQHLGRTRHPTESDWIVNDPLDPIQDYDQNDAQTAQPAHTIAPDATPYPPLIDRLANSILIAGPTGSGKTAAVHAAATELGWEVFEVYPGIGKRSGEALRVLVGDVGKNHMVGKRHISEAGPDRSPPVKAKKNAIGVFFAKKQGGKDEVAVQEEEETGFRPGHPNECGPGDLGFIEIDEENPAVEQLENGSGRTKFRQSLILLEEVDVLYKEDQGFWQGVVGLIAESKRPVVMTCTDPATIPLLELPLQTLLRFRRPPESLALAYLSAVAEHEDTSTAASKLNTLVRGRASGMAGGLNVLGDQALTPGTCMRVLDDLDGGVDLRGCLAQMQYELATGGSPCHVSLKAVPLVGADITATARSLETNSFADCFVGLKTEYELDATEVDRMKSSDNDEVPAIEERPMLKPRPKDCWPALTAYTREDDMVSALSTSLDHPDLIIPRCLYQHATLAYLDRLVHPEDYLLPHPSVFLDLIPAISWMVNIDDRLQSEDTDLAARGEERVNRRTGRLMRIGGAGAVAYERQLIGLDEEGSEAVRMTRLLALTESV